MKHTILSTGPRKALAHLFYLAHLAYRSLMLSGLVFLLAGCTGAVGPMGPSGAQGGAGSPGNPGTPGSSGVWQTIASEYFETTQLSRTPADITAYTTGAAWSSATVTNTMFLSPNNSLALACGLGSTGGAFFAFSPVSSSAVAANFAVNRSGVDVSSAISTTTPVLTCRLVVGSQLVAWVDLVNSPGATNDQLVVHYGSNSVSQPWYPQPWSVISLSYDPATGLSSVSVDGSPYGVNLPVKSVYYSSGHPSSYVEWQYTGQQGTSVYYIDDLTVSQP